MISCFVLFYSVILRVRTLNVNESAETPNSFKNNVQVVFNFRLIGYYK